METVVHIYFKSVRHAVVSDRWGGGACRNVASGTGDKKQQYNL